MKTLLLSLFTIVLAASCSTRRTVEEQPVSIEVLDPGTHPSLTPLPDPEMNGGHIGRAPRRITVAQLKQSIQITTGTQWSQIDTLAASLGQADFAVTSSESIETNLLFTKFLEDGAREVCLRAAGADLTKEPTLRVLSQGITNAEAGGNGRDFTKLTDEKIDATLSTLSLRFWGAPMGAEELSSWRSTFRTVATRAKTINKPEQAWGAMCIAFITDPRFFTY